MLKQFSLPQKIFGTTTLLLGMCYVGVLVYVQGAFAADNPDWVQYNATVVNIMKVNDNKKEYQLNTDHGVYYDNTDRDVSDSIRIKGRARWTKNGVTKNQDERTTREPIAAGSEGWYATTRSKNQRITDDPDDEWMGQAYTNLLVGDWASAFPGASAINTEHFNHGNYKANHPGKRPLTAVYSKPAINE